MRCPHCNNDSDEACVPEAFKEAIDDLDNFGNRIDDDELSEEELAEALYAEADLMYQTEEDEDDDQNGEWVSGPFDVSYLEALVYRYPDGSTEEVESPNHYYVTETGDHLISVEDEEVGVVIAAGWRRIERFPRYGLTPFNITE